MKKYLLVAFVAGLLFGMAWLRLRNNPESVRTRTVAASVMADFDAAARSLATNHPRRAELAQSLLPYLEALLDPGTLDAKSVLRMRTLVETWFFADPGACSEFLR